MSSGVALVPQTGADRETRDRLLANLIMKNGTREQVELVIAIADRYSLDPLLKHLVLINGAAYITRDGLLHIAHQSGQFDGIEVGLDQLDDGEWAATCTVYRKDKTRPFRYTVYQREHQQKGGAWTQYPRAMLAKTAEVACLRRAFDVSLGAVEELGYDGESPQSSSGRVVTVDGEVRYPDPPPAALPAPPPKLSELADSRLLALLADEAHDAKGRYGAAHYYLARATDAATLNDRYAALAALGKPERQKLYAHHAERLGLPVGDPIGPADPSWDYRQAAEPIEAAVVEAPHRYPTDNDDVPF